MAETKPQIKEPEKKEIKSDTITKIEGDNNKALQTLKEVVELLKQEDNK